MVVARRCCHRWRSRICCHWCAIVSSRSCSIDRVTCDFESRNDRVHCSASICPSRSCHSWCRICCSDCWPMTFARPCTIVLARGWRSTSTLSTRCRWSCDGRLVCGNAACWSSWRYFRWHGQISIEVCCRSCVNIKIKNNSNPNGTYPWVFSIELRFSVTFKDPFVVRLLPRGRFTSFRTALSSGGS